MFGRLARRGHHLEAGLRQHRDGGAPDATRRSRDEHRAVVGVRPVLEQAAQRQQGGEPGQPDDGGVATAEGLGQRHDPVRGHARVGGEAAVVGHPEVVALDEHSLAGAEVGTRALLDTAGELDAGDEGKAASDPVARARDHGVLEVDGGPLDAHEDLAFGQVGFGELDDRGTDHLARLGEQVGREAHRITVEGGAAGALRRAGHRVPSDAWPPLHAMGVGPPRSQRPTSRGPRCRCQSFVRTAKPSTGSSPGRPRPGESSSCAPVTAR